MMKWIDFMNKMYENNPYTNDGRVVVSYCDNMDVVVVKVLSNYKVIEVGDLNEFGMMYKINDVVCEMYGA